MREVAKRVSLSLNIYGCVNILLLLKVFTLKISEL